MLTINTNAPAVTRAHAVIEAPAELVFDVLADVANWPEWQTAVSKVSVDGTLRSGSSFRWRSGGTTITSTIGVIERPGRLGWTGRARGTRAVHVWRLASDGEHTQLETEESMEGWLVRLLRPVMRRVLERGVHDAVRQLKAEAERRHQLARAVAR